MTDIGLFGFSWIKGNGIFSMDLDSGLMSVEHQSTSETKIYSGQPYAMAILPDLRAIVITD